MTGVGTGTDIPPPLATRRHCGGAPLWVTPVASIVSFAFPLLPSPLAFLCLRPVVLGMKHRSKGEGTLRTKEGRVQPDQDPGR